MTSTLSPRAGRLAEQLQVWPKARVPLLDLWRMLDRADPSSRTDSRRRFLLSGLLDELAGAGVVQLPSRSYDRTEQPYLPQFVTILRLGQSVATPRDIVWHPALSWVPGSQPTSSQLDLLAAVNQWLFRHRDDLVVPIRERSLEIFGEEKLLDRLMLTNLFAPGRLSPELLRIRRAVPQMYTRIVGDGSTLLVVENSDTFDSLVRVLSDSGGPIGLVGWGAGAGFEASVVSIANLERPVSEMRYFGDLDRAGLRIPSNASALAVATGLPPVRPFTGLYGALLSVGRRQAGQTAVSSSEGERLVQWLDPAHRQSVVRMLAAGERMAQEAVGYSYLLRHDDWRTD